MLLHQAGGAHRALRKRLLMGAQLNTQGFLPVAFVPVTFYNKGNTAQFPPAGLSTAPAELRAKSRRKRRLRSEALRCGSVCGTASSIICAFGLAAAAPRSPYRHLELCGIA